MIGPDGVVVLGRREVAVLLLVARAGLVALDRRNGAPPVEGVRLVGELTEALRGQQVPRNQSRWDGGSGTDLVPRKGFRAVSASTDTDWLSIAEAALRLDCSEGYVRRLCRRGTVLAKRSAAGAWLVDAKSLAA